MFEEIFKKEILHIVEDFTLIDELWTEIKTNYDKRARHYHNIFHLDSLIEQLLPVRSHIGDWQTLIFSVAYHDIVYNILKKDNEEKSAALAYDRLTKLNCPVPQKEKCKLQILATKQHQMSSDTDTNYFIDADLSILGFDNKSYFKYTGQIRKEYRHFPDIIYKPGRRKVLSSFLKMKNIFKTKYFQDKYEEQAKINILNELNSLS